MSTVKWNDEQQKAIDKTGCNILVSAGAGSGKTAVLTERIVSLIEKGAGIMDFAVCTFTRKATLEMKERIMGRLLEKGLDEQAELAASASIFTIDAFCKRIVEENFEACGLPAKFSVLSDSRVLEEQALNKALNELFEDEEFVGFATGVSPNNDNRIRELIKKAYDFCSNIPDYEALLNGQLAMLKNKDYTALKSEYAHIKAVELKGIMGEYNAFCDLPYAADEEISTLDSDLKTMGDILKALEQGEIDIAVPAFDRMKKNMPNKDILQKLRNKPKDLIKDIMRFKELLFCEPVLKAEKQGICMLIKAIEVFDNAYMEIKISDGVLTFNDLNRFAYKILQNEDIASEYRNRYKYVLVDEYQDTSRLQQAIINRIKRKDNLFMVGDIKQSIYGFRNADPSMFYNVYSTYKESGENVKIDLFKNYRSQKNILDFVNGVFSVLLNIGKEYYPKDAFLDTDSKEKGNPVEIDFLVHDEDDYSVKADRIAKRIDECIKIGYSPKDIAVLFSSVKAGTPVVLYEMLRKKNIAVQVSAAKDSRFMETRVFLNLLRIIDNADNDIPLLSVMYSELGGFSLDDIIEIRNGKEGSFYSCVRVYKGKIELESRIKSFLDMIDDFANDSLNMTVSELMISIFSRTGYIRMVEMRENGRAKAAQLYGLIKQANEFEALGQYSLSDFLEYAGKFEKSGEDDGEDGFVGSGNAVNIMTIHKSKGLEFKVVILGDIDKQIYGSNSESPGCVFNKNIGAGVEYINTEKGAKLEGPYMELIKMINRQNAFEEKMRLLYVAMTRAKERLFIVGRVDSEQAALLKDLDEYMPKEIGNGKFKYLDALIMGLKNKNGCGDYNINFVKAEKSIKSEKEIFVTPEYVEEVSAALDGVNDTSVTVVPKKIAATKITKEEKPFVAYLARGKKTEISGAKAGTVTHGLIYHLRQGESFNELILRMKGGDYFTAEELNLADKNMIDNFTNSGVYKRILKANRVYKEKPFMIELDEKSGFTDGLYMVQGIIDCLFEEDGRFVLVDYKTDNIVKDAEQKLKELYKKQLNLYAYAVEMLTGKPVKEKIILHLKTGNEIYV